MRPQTAAGWSSVWSARRARYACAFGGMINQWRDAWTGIGDFAFIYAQLSAYTGYSRFAGHGDTSVVRLAQADSLSHIGLDTTGMAVTFDLGDPKAPLGDVHSRRKDGVAYRSGQCAGAGVAMLAAALLEAGAGAWRGAPLPAAWAVGALATLWTERRRVD